MKLTGNTVLITGGGSGIGRGVAEILHARGNKVIVAGHLEKELEDFARDIPDISTYVFDLRNASDVARLAASVSAEHPDLNVLINNAGIMCIEDFTGDDIDLSIAEAEVSTNLLGPIRLTAALLPHLRSRPAATLINTSSALAFVPLAAAATYSATKAAVHAFTVSLRHQLRNTTVEVLEIVPPYIQTALMGEHQRTDPNAMPLDAFLAEVFELLQSQPTPSEIVVQRARHHRLAEAENRYDAAFQLTNPQ